MSKKTETQERRRKERAEQKAARQKEHQRRMEAGANQKRKGGAEKLLPWQRLVRRPDPLAVTE